MTAPIETTAAATEAQPEAVLAGAGKGRIEGRSLGQIAWTRFKRDKAAMAGGIVVVLLILVAMLSKPLQSLLGLDPNAFNQSLVDPVMLAPKGSLGGISWDHPLGVEPQTGRDILARILEGSWVSLVVAVGSTLLSVVIGVESSRMRPQTDGRASAHTRAAIGHAVACSDCEWFGHSFRFAVRACIEIDVVNAGAARDEADASLWPAPLNLYRSGRVDAQRIGIEVDRQREVHRDGHALGRG